MRIAVILLLFSVADATAADIVFEAANGTMTVTGVAEIDSIPDYAGIEGSEAIMLRLSDEDALEFADLTGRNIGEPLSVRICGTEMMRPVVMERITYGSLQITGIRPEEADQIVGAVRGEVGCEDVTLTPYDG